MTLYPLFAKLSGRAVLVVGGGAVAARKIGALLDAGAEVRVVAPVLHVRIRHWVATGRVRHLATAYRARQLDTVWLVVCATDDDALNAAVAAHANARRVFANVVDDAARCSVHVPAVVHRTPLTVAVSSGGAAPVLARRVRGRIEALLDPALGPLAALLGRWRARIRHRLPAPDARRRFLETLDEGPVADLLRQGRADAAERELANALADAAAAPPAGCVALVGAGPGDPALLTLAALRQLQQADVILHDSLVSPAVLALARRDADCIAVGKRAGSHATAQADIHAAMRAHALAGRRVVRLKGGDPFVFGRGGEELEFLRANRIPYEVVPGVSAAFACAAYAGVPLTHRRHVQSLHLATAHCSGPHDTLDWCALATQSQTLVFYMGVGALARIAERLIAHGLAATTPFALVENGSLPCQRVVAGQLGRLAMLARRHAVQAPALLIVGEVAVFATTLHWFGESPLTDAHTGAAARLPAGTHEHVHSVRATQSAAFDG